MLGKLLKRVAKTLKKAASVGKKLSQSTGKDVLSRRGPPRRKKNRLFAALPMSYSTLYFRAVTFLL
jgi:hypothetical protein